MHLSRSKHYRSTPLIQPQTFDQRQWLNKHGKGNCVTFSQNMLNKLHSYFRSLDADGSNSISSNELEDPLILFGLCKSREQVNQLFKSYCQYIQFWTSMDQEKWSLNSSYTSLGRWSLIAGNAAFAEKVRLTERCNNSQVLQQKGTLMGMQGKLEQGVSFRLGMSIYRRKHLINAITGKNIQSRIQSKQIMQKFQQQITSNPQTKSRLLSPRNLPQELHTNTTPNSTLRTKFHRRLKTMG